MSDKKYKSSYSAAVRVTCIALAVLTVLGAVGTLIYIISTI